jgi:hypothetical protein
MTNTECASKINQTGSNFAGGKTEEAPTNLKTASDVAMLDFQCLNSKIRSHPDKRDTNGFVDDAAGIS